MHIYSKKIDYDKHIQLITIKMVGAGFQHW